MRDCVHSRNSDKGLKMKKFENFGVRIDPDLNWRLSRVLAEQRKTKTEFWKEVVEEYLEKHEQDHKNTVSQP